MTCQEYGKKLVRQNMLGGGIGADGQGGGGGLESLLLLDSSGDGNIKQCPMCHLRNDQATKCSPARCSGKKFENLALNSWAHMYALDKTPHLRNSLYQLNSTLDVMN